MPDLDTPDGYQGCVLDAMQELLRPLLEKDWEPLGTALHNHLFGLPGPTEVNRPKTGKQIHVAKIFQGYIEITKSLDTLELIAACIGKAPPSRIGISADRYLQFLYEAHLHEMYVLEQRLRKYLATIERQFRGDKRLPFIKEGFKKLSTAVTDALKPVVTIRGTHVHQVRVSENNIDRLSTMTLLCKSPDTKLVHAMRWFQREETLKIRKQMKKYVNDSNKKTSKLVDAYLGVLRRFVFNKDRTIKYPSRLELGFNPHKSRG